MKINLFVLTMFPEIYDLFKETGVIGKALRNERSDYEINFTAFNITNFSEKGFKGVDDSSYGGGPGMVMKADVLKNAYNHIKSQSKNLKTIYLSPLGKLWDRNQALKMAKECKSESDFLFICGRYEGIDQRFIDKYVDAQFSIGDFVLSCGDWALVSIIDSMLRFVPGVIGDPESVAQDSFENCLLDHPHYTKPAIFEDMEVPQILKSGNHKKIEEWRFDKKIENTKSLRPDLYKQYINKIDQKNKDK